MSAKVDKKILENREKYTKELEGQRAAMVAAKETLVAMNNWMNNHEERLKYLESPLRRRIAVRLKGVIRGK